MTIGVSVAYLSVPFYANFMTGLEEGARRFGFDYNLRDGGGGDLAVELANIQDFIAAEFWRQTWPAYQSSK
jgi:ABC-type sugar transport system substrate-binding protein